MAICSRCGNYAPDGTVMCPVCGTPFQFTPQGAPPPVQPMAPQGQMMQGGVEVVSPPSIPSMESIGTIASNSATQAVRQAAQQVASNAGLGSIPSIPTIPSIPSAGAIGSMASGGVAQAAKQVVQQFTGGVDVMATEAQGEIVLSSWQMPTNPSSVVQMGAKAVQSAKKGKGAWAWFLIPAVTILAWVISQLAK